MHFNWGSHRLVLAATVAAVGIGAPAVLVGTAHAAPEARPSRPTEAIVAIGEVSDAGGASCTVDIAAATRARTRGALRFYCPDIGFYNGAVRTLTVEGNTASMSGGGALTGPDGKRERVQYTATLSTDSKSVAINVTAGDGDTYTISGTLSPGFTRSGVPTQQPSATPAAS